MNRVFQQVDHLRKVFCRSLCGQEFEPMAMAELNISELLFADDTLVFAEPGHSSDDFYAQSKQSLGCTGSLSSELKAR